AKGVVHARGRRQGSRRGYRLGPAARRRTGRGGARRSRRGSARSARPGARHQGAAAGLPDVRAQRRRAARRMSVVTASPVLRGERVTLRPMTHADAPHLVRWGNDADFAWNQWGRNPGRFGDDATARAWMDFFAGRAGKVFVIEYAGRPIGQVNYRDLQPKGRSAEVGIGIGE